MGQVTFSLSDDDVERIAHAVARIVTPAHDRWLDVKAASEYTSLSPEAIRTSSKRGKLQGRKGASGRLVFSVAELDRFMGGK